MAVIPGEGTILKVGTTSTVAAVAKVNNISLGAVEQEAVDSFSLDSTLKETRPSRLPDPGSLTFNLYIITGNTQQELIRTSSTNHSILYWEVEDVDGNTATFQGFVTSYEENGMEVESNKSADVEVKLTTLITYAEAA